MTPIHIEGSGLGFLLGQAIIKMVAAVDHIVHVGVAIVFIVILQKNCGS
jgi:hypothetical protein